HFVPSILASFLNEPAASRISSLRRVICSGEVLMPQLAEKCSRITGARVSNLYGPTEAAIDVTTWDDGSRSGSGRLPIGHAIDQVFVYVVDSELRMLPIGACGELA